MGTREHLIPAIGVAGSGNDEVIASILMRVDEDQVIPRPKPSFETGFSVPLFDAHVAVGRGSSFQHDVTLTGIVSW